uniref:Coilin n=1 Tax=Naja naja TaxID=35670 RepID=A0A8C6VE96_NAJNA
MAAAIGSGCEAPVRLRLLFDYPPPVSPACGLCWLLVEPNQVRLITDLISLIREKFGFSRHARLNLFLDGALLPPTESARLVRDNDSLRWEPCKSKKGPGRGELLGYYTALGYGDGGKTGSERAGCKEREKEESKYISIKGISKKTEKSLSQKSTKGNTIAQSSAKKCSSSSESSTTSDSDHITPATKQTNTHASKGTSQQIKKPQLASLKTLSAGKDKVSLKTGQTKKTKSQSSSSDSDSSSEEKQQSSNLRNKRPYQKQGTVTGHSSKKQKANATGNLSVRGNDDKQLSDVSCGLASNLWENGKGRGRGEAPFWRGPRVRGCRGVTRDRGRGERIHFFYNHSSENQKQKQLNEAATNASVVIQNPVEAPKKDYSGLPLLAAPPQVGQKIAFKVFFFQLCNMKGGEGKIVSWNPVNKQLDLEILSFSSVAKEPGKFDLIYQSEDGNKTIEYAVSQDRKV